MSKRTEIISTSIIENTKDSDEKLREIILGMTIGELNTVCESYYGKTMTSKYWISTVVRDAIAQLDIAAIKTIIQRLDGGVPDKKNRDNYANYIGMFLEEVMSYPIEEVRVLRFDDNVYIALAKAILHISLQKPIDNNARRDKNLATEIIFERCGGRVSEPVKELMDVRYVEPDWMNQLPSGDNSVL